MKKLLTLALLVLLAMPATATRSVSVPDSREYKVLLNADNFVSVKKGCELFWDLVEKVAADHGFSAKKSVKSSPDRAIYFFDTPGFDLNKKGFVLRLRMSGKEPKSRQSRSRSAPDRGEAFTENPSALGADAELTLKFRATDIESAMIAPVEPGKEYGNDVSAEVDIVVKAATPVSIFSRSGKINNFAAVPGSVKELLKYYPRLAIAGLNAALSLKIVNNLVVIEQRILHGSIDFDRKKTKTIFSVWYKRGESKPLVAEFSFKIKLSKSDPERAAKHQKMVDNFFVDLVRRGKLFISPNQTKTGMIYQHQSKD